jgi:hypothetical protein
MLPHFSQPFRRATWLPFVFSNAGSRQFSLLKFMGIELKISRRTTLLRFL